jgi:hypothetical protein
LPSSAISTGVYGIAGQCFFVVTAPVRAQEMMTLSLDTAGYYRASARRVAGDMRSPLISVRPIR